MMRRALVALGRVQPRVVTGTLLLVIGLMFFETWMLTLRKPLAAYRRISAAHSALAVAVESSRRQADDLSAVASELKLLTDKLSGQLHIRASDDEMAASLMAALDQSAARYSIALSGMKPGERRQVSVFEEVTFEVNGSGSYLDLSQWMFDFERTLGNSASISEFDMKSTGAVGQVTLTFNIALYRPLRLTEAHL